VENFVGGIVMACALGVFGVMDIKDSYTIRKKYITITIV